METRECLSLGAAALPQVHPPLLATCFLPRMSRFSFDHDIMSCIKLKTAKYHLIYSNFLKSSQKPLLNDANLQIIPITKEKPNHYGHQPQHKSTRSPESSLALTLSSAQAGFSITCFSGSREWGAGNAPFPFQKPGTLKNISKQATRTRRNAAHTCRSSVLGFRLLSALQPGLRPGPHVSTASRTRMEWLYLHLGG